MSTVKLITNACRVLEYEDAQISHFAEYGRF